MAKAGGGWKSKVRPLLGLVAFGAMLYSAATATAPNLISDWQIKDAVQPATGGRLIGGKCSSYAVLHICNADLSVQTKSGPVPRHVQFVFGGFHVGDYSARIVADPDRPELATTDLAMDRLWNRTITLAITSLILVTLLCTTAWSLLIG